jgi:hypothetical protein
MIPLYLRVRLASKVSHHEKFELHAVSSHLGFEDGERVTLVISAYCVTISIYAVR